MDTATAHGNMDTVTAHTNRDTCTPQVKVQTQTQAQHTCKYTYRKTSYKP